MTNESNGADPSAPCNDDRLAEIRRLSDEIRTLLEEMIALARADPAAVKPAELLRKLGELQSTHLKVIEKEAAFDDKIAKDRAEATDYDAIRAEIGRRLDRIRATRDAGGVCDRP